MKLYNKKKMIIAAGEFLLAGVSITTIVLLKSHDIKFIILSLSCLLMSLYSGSCAFSKQKADEDLAENLYDRDNTIAMRVNDKLLKIYCVTTICLIISGILIYTMTKNLNVVIAILPLMILMLIFFFLYIILYLYYEKECDMKK